MPSSLIMAPAKRSLSIILLLLFLVNSTCSSGNSLASNQQEDYTNASNVKPTIAPRVRSGSKQNASLFKTNCEMRKAWHISLPNGFIYIYCTWNEHQVNDVAFNFLSQNHGVSDLEQKHQVWNQSMRILRRDGFLSVCALQCKKGIPYPRFNRYEGSQIPEPDSVNLGCHDWQNLKCKDSCPDEIYDVPNGNILCSDGSFAGSFCKLACHATFRTVGSVERLCNPVTGQWQPKKAFQCAAVKTQACSRLAPVANGRLLCSKGNQQLSRCVLKCNGGFLHIGSMIQWCLPDANDNMVWYYSTHNGEVHTSRNGAPVQCKSIQLIAETSPNVQNQVNEEGGTDRENRREEVLGNGTTGLKRLGVCDVAPQSRVNCGFTYKSKCLASFCCWDSGQIGVPWCFEKNANPVNEAVKSSNPKPTNNSKPQTNRPNSGASNLSAQGQSSLPAELNQHEYRPHPLSSACGCSSEIYSRCETGIRRVYCGQSAHASDFPWNALLYLGDEICGGTLIAAQYIVTAGHCIPKFEGSLSNLRNNYIFLGLSNTSNPGPTTQHRVMIGFQQHPNFTASNAHATNDVAIIKLDKPVILTASVQPLCLPGSRHPGVQDTCFIMGFGKTNPTSRTAKVFQAAKVPIVTVLHCSRFYRSFVISEQNICAGSGQPNTPDTCKGDSGGPLACKHGTGRCSWYLAGITSFGTSPCGRAAPSVYVNVYHYQEWIYSTIELMERYAG